MFGIEDTREFMEMTIEEQEALIEDLKKIYDEEMREEEEDRAQEKAYEELQNLLKEMA